MNPILLRRNIVDTATLSSTGFSTTLPVSYLKLQDRSALAQSTGLDFGSPSIGPSIKGSYATAQTIDMFALRYHNLTAAATWRLILYSDAAFTTVIYDSGNVNAFAYSNIPADITPEYFKLMKNSAMYFAKQTTMKSWILTINDSANPDGVIKISRAFAGEKWEFARGVRRGMFPLRFLSTAKSRRAHDGSRRSSAGAQYLGLDLNHETFDEGADMRALLDAFSYLDETRDFWFSLFPNRGTWMEMWYQNAWKLVGDRVADLYFITASRARLQMESN